MSLTLHDLKEASYNPRVISAKKLGGLSRSMRRYGDLSGVVFNRRTKTLISGHQRLKTLRVDGVKTKIVTERRTDNFGTVAEGHVIAFTDDGEIRLPIRIVDWNDRKSEMAANIAANAHGGDFDNVKLGVVLQKLQAGKEFDVDTIGLSTTSMRNLISKVAPLENTVNTHVTIGGKKARNEREWEFDLSKRKRRAPSSEYDDETDLDFHQPVVFAHTCPHCSHQFNDGDTVASARRAVVAVKKTPKVLHDTADEENSEDKLHTVRRPKLSPSVSKKPKQRIRLSSALSARKRAK